MTAPGCRRSHAVWIGYVGAGGVATQRALAPVTVEAGLVTGFHHTAGEIRTYPLHRITKGEQRRDGQGRGIPVPPVSFLAVRAAVRTRDPRLLASTPTLGQALADAADDGRDVLRAHHLSHDWKDIRAWAAQCLPVRLPPEKPPLPPAVAPPHCG